jgi:hypothetical protein
VFPVRSLSRIRNSFPRAFGENPGR